MVNPHFCVEKYFCQKVTGIAAFLQSPKTTNNFCIEYFEQF
jgi:hypothetical protein